MVAEQTPGRLERRHEGLARPANAAAESASAALVLGVQGAHGGHGRDFNAAADILRILLVESFGK